MKKIIFAICLMAFSFFFAAAAPDHDYAISFDQLPAVSRTFVNTHFAGIAVAYCMRDSHSYEARLSDGSEIEFNLDGSWKEVDCKYKELPKTVTDLLPKTVQSYIKSNYPTAVITKIDVKFRGYELELNNGLDVEFDSAGNFIRIDD